MASLNIAGVLKPAAKGHGGAHVAHHKNTSAMPVERMPVPASVTIPLSQHIGAPNEAQVKVGDEVKVGQVIAEGDGFVSAPVHASVSGKVKKLDDILLSNGSYITTVVIESDGEDAIYEGLAPHPVETVEEFVAAVRESGIVGLGGAGFPASVKLAADPAYATAILAIGRGGKKPRKDLATWVDAKPYMGFFYDDYLEIPVFDEKFDKAVVIDALNRFLACFDINDDSAVWFDKVKAVTEAMGFTTDMKAYKADPDAFPGTVADVSTFIRQAVTGKTNSPDLYTVMQILGYDRTVERIKATMEILK